MDNFNAFSGTEPLTDGQPTPFVWVFQPSAFSQPWHALQDASATGAPVPIVAPESDFDLTKELSDVMTPA